MRHTSLARTVTDLARLLEVMVGYDPEDPLTAVPYGNIPPNFTVFSQLTRTSRQPIIASRRPACRT